MSQSGQKQDAADIFSDVIERRLTVRQHNGWQYVGKTRQLIFDRPRNGKYFSKFTLDFDEFYLSEDIALIFQFDVVV